MCASEVAHEGMKMNMKLRSRPLCNFSALHSQLRAKGRPKQNQNSQLDRIFVISLD